MTLLPLPLRGAGIIDLHIRDCVFLVASKPWRPAFWIISWLRSAVWFCSFMSKFFHVLCSVAEIRQDSFFPPLPLGKRSLIAPSTHDYYLLSPSVFPCSCFILAHVSAFTFCRFHIPVEDLSFWSVDIFIPICHRLWYVPGTYFDDHTLSLVSKENYIKFQGLSLLPSYHCLNFVCSWGLQMSLFCILLLSHPVFFRFFFPFKYDFKKHSPITSVKIYHFPCSQ